MKTPIVFLALLVASAAAAAAPARTSNDTGSLLPGGGSKEPVSIEADKLVYFEKELKAIYTGNVIVIQGDSKLTCSTMTIFMEKAAEPANAAAATSAPSKDPGEPAPSNQSSRVKHMDCAGPVTVVSKTQTATGDSASYDKPQNRVYLIGHVTLSDGGNVTKGDKLTYDMATGQATVDTGGSAGRVKGQFIPGGADSTGGAKPKAPK